MKKGYVYIFISITLSFILAVVLYYTIPRVSYKVYDEYSSLKSSYGKLQTITLKEEYKGKKLEAIEIRGFQNQTKLVEIVMPDSIKNIGKLTFDNCISLESVTMPKELVYCGNNTFRNCTSLKKVEFKVDSKLDEIAGYTFYNCISLEEINIPSSVKEVSSYAFSNCKSLKRLELPQNLKYVRTDAFNGCDSLEEIYVSRSTNLAVNWLNGTKKGLKIFYY